MTTTRKHIGRRIRQIRASQKITQAQLAQQINVSPATVSGWEIGDSGISLEAATRVAELAGVTLDWLLHEKETPGADLADGHTPEEIKLLENYRRLTRTSQTALSRISEMMHK
jgi:transcriptional regulator with XRE-family HTH domain